jgi:hypothetical protein
MGFGEDDAQARRSRHWVGLRRFLGPQSYEWVCIILMVNACGVCMERPYRMPEMSAIRPYILQERGNRVYYYKH